MDLCFKEHPRLLVGGGYNWFDENPEQKLRGIYAAVCLENERIYIGSSKDFEKRWRKGHIKDLRKNDHDNLSFQNSYNKYGEKSIFWYWVEDLPEDQDLLEVEFDNYITPLVESNPATRRIFNHVRIYLKSAKAGDPWSQEMRLARIAKMRGTTDPYKIKDPYGKIYEFNYSIRDFAEEHGIDRKGLGQVIKGDLEYYSGWCLPNTPNLPIKIHRIEKIDTSEIFEFENPAQFSRDNGIAYSSLIAVLNGVNRYSSGYKLPETALEKEVIYKFKSPDGKIEEFTSTRQFADGVGVAIGTARNFFKGKMLTCHGWSQLNYEPKIWTFIDQYGKEWDTDSPSRFAQEQGLSKAGLSNIRSKLGQSHKGWTFKFPDNYIQPPPPPKKEKQKKPWKPRAKRKKKEPVDPYKLRSPKGKIYQFVNLNKFCEKRGFELSEVLKVLNGELSEYMGWELPEEKLKRLPSYRLEGIETGEIIEFCSVTSFAETHQMLSQSVWALLNGKNATSNGFKKPETSFPVLKLKSPNGKIVEFISIAQFSKENNLNDQEIRALLRKERKSHKGWTNLDYSLPTWTLLDPSGIEWTTTNLAKLARDHGLNKSGFQSLTSSSPVKTYKGWTLKSKTK